MSFSRFSINIGNTRNPSTNDLIIIWCSRGRIKTKSVYILFFVAYLVRLNEYVMLFTFVFVAPFFPFRIGVALIRIISQNCILKDVLTYVFDKPYSSVLSCLTHNDYPYLANNPVIFHFPEWFMAGAVRDSHFIFFRLFCL